MLRLVLDVLWFLHTKTAPYTSIAGFVHTLGFAKTHGSVSAARICKISLSTRRHALGSGPQPGVMHTDPTQHQNQLPTNNGPKQLPSAQ
ncbi:hypothetical protein BaRGS_00006317 [Batillaria attramentaria]|uniref:Secreted protein n=1 Tax=Batillaria attramentaria TaxID=370345 RepID=A0ABD0LS39_9CAEN